MRWRDRCVTVVWVQNNGNRLEAYWKPMKLLFPRICYVHHQGNPSIHINIIFLCLFNNRIMFVENNSFFSLLSLLKQNSWQMLRSPPRDDVLSNWKQKHQSVMPNICLKWCKSMSCGVSRAITSAVWGLKDGGNRQMRLMRDSFRVRMNIKMARRETLSLYKPYKHTSLSPSAPWLLPLYI